MRAYWTGIAAVLFMSVTVSTATAETECSRIKAEAGAAIAAENALHVAILHLQNPEDVYLEGVARQFELDGVGEAELRAMLRDQQDLKKGLREAAQAGRTDASECPCAETLEGLK